MSDTRTALPVCEPNITPMLDVLLVLLIAFMAMSIRMHHTIDAVLPQPCTGTCATGVPIVLEVLAGPSYRINGSSVSDGLLRSKLAAIYAERTEKVLQVAGHQGANYQDVMTAMDIARSAGVLAIGIVPRASGTSGRLVGAP